jgi:SAM-dependent methyltransferase
MIPHAPEKWQELWNLHLDQYLAASPRTGCYLEMLFPDKSLSFLEIGGGSLRDANYLAQRGYAATGSDYVPDLVATAARRHNNPRLHTLVLDAFDTKLPDGAFDVTFHNGLIGYFDDGQISKLVAEQARITRKHLVVVTHCRHNANMARVFAEKAQTDSLYGLRFFTKSEMRVLLDRFGPTRLYPFGGPIDARLLPGNRLGCLPLRLRRAIYTTFASLTSPSRWERILAVTRLKK